MDIEKALTELIELGNMEPCEMRKYFAKTLDDAKYLEYDYNVYASVTGFITGRLEHIRNEIKIKRMQEEKI